MKSIDQDHWVSRTAVAIVIVTFLALTSVLAASNTAATSAAKPEAAVKRGYLDLVDRAPHVLGYFYDRFDRPKKKKRAGGEKLRLAVEGLNMRPFLKLLRAERWDIIVNTHFLPVEIVASLRR